MPVKNRPTLKSIAGECGVSEMTVSRVLRNKPNVSAKVRERVEACATRLGYRPDPLLSALINRRRSTGKNRTGEQLALIVPEESRFGWGKFAVLREFEAEAVDAAESFGYRIRTFRISADGSTLPQTLRMLSARGVRGVILAHALDVSRVPASLWEEFAVLTLEPGAHNARFHAVRNDYFQMCECAVETFYERDIRRIGYVIGPTDALAHFRPVGALASCEHMLTSLSTETFTPDGWAERVPAKFVRWVERFQPEALIAVSTHPLKWLQDHRALRNRDIGFAQLNRPLADKWINGVCTPPGAHGLMLIQRLHQLLLNDDRGIPEVRAVVRVDGHWRNKGE